MFIVSCPTAVSGTECSGHGVCWDMGEIASDGGMVYGSNSVTQSTIAWDFNVMKGCLCNSSWEVGYGNGEYQLSEYYQPDCSLQRCPSGDNPFTCEDEEDCFGRNQINGVTTGAFGNKCHTECSNRGYCNHTTGTCSCFVGSIGVACDQLAGGQYHVCLLL